MTRDEIRKILGENAAEETIDAIVDKFQAGADSYKEQIKSANQELKKVQDEVKKYSDYDEIKKKLADINKANMTKEQQLEAREKSIVEKEKEINLRNNKSIANEILSKYGLEENVVNSILNENSEITTQNAQALAKQLDLIKENAIKTTKESLINANVQPNINDKKSDVGMTFEKFNQMSATEQNELLNNDPEMLTRI